jgi:hypothetical protein
MYFNAIVNNILEGFRAPTDTKRPIKVRPKGKYGTINPQLNEPHDTKAVSGFLGQPGGKVNTVFYKVPTRKKSPRRS